MPSTNPITIRLPFILILIVLVTLVSYLQWPESKQKKEKFQRIVKVKVTQAKHAEFRDIIEAIGTARANEQVVVTSKYSNIVDSVSFNDGQHVKKGDILVQLNNKEELAKVSELSANLSESEAQLNRFKELLISRATSKSQVDQQDAKTNAIAAQLLIARTKLEDLTIKAPFSGILGFRELSIGAYIQSGSVITSLDDLSIIKVNFSLPERFLTTIHIGQDVSAYSNAYKDEIFIGKISSIDSRIEPSTRTLKVRAEIPNGQFKLRPGMLLNIKVVRQIETILQLPESTIIPIEDEHYIFIIESESEAQASDLNKIAKRRLITIGRRQPGVVEVISGVNEGEQVVTEGALKLRDGSLVHVLQQVHQGSDK